MSRFLLIPAVCLLVGSFPQVAPAEVEIRKGCIAHFTRAAEGTSVLGQKDDFIQRLSPFDRAARMKTDQPVPEDKFLSFVRSNVTTWTPVEQSKVEDAIRDLRPALEKFTVPFPSSVLFVVTTGAEEGGAFYTRGNAIIMPQKKIQEANPELLRKTIAHELFHVLSRSNPKIRAQLYRAIGFAHCGEVELPVEIQSRKITNPDAPLNDHAIRVRLNGREMSAVPVLFSKSEKYDPARGGEFFNYLQMQLLIAETFPAAKPDLVDLTAVSGFFEQIGRNTDYIIHPEEILAENFALLVTGATKLPSPEITDKLRRVLEQK